MKLAILFDHDAEVAAWVFARLPYGPQCLADMPRDWFRALGVLRGGKLCGGMVWHDRQQNGGSIQISVAGEGPWISREVAAVLVPWPFRTLGVAHVQARHAASNDKATKGIQHLGWEFEGRQKLAWDGREDALLFGLTKGKAEKIWGAQ